MTVTQARRIRLQQQLIEKLGEEAAMTLMESLPPASWEKLATKEDLAVEMGKLRGEMAELRGEMKLGLARQTFIVLAGLIAAMTPIYFALFTGAGA